MIFFRTSCRSFLVVVVFFFLFFFFSSYALLFNFLDWRDMRVSLCTAQGKNETSLEIGGQAWLTKALFS